MALFSKENTPAPAATRTNAPQPTGGSTFIGPNITIDGTVTGSEPIVIEGTVRGKINVTADLRVGTKARVEAEVHARNVTVEGQITGNISADDRLELVASAVVEGNLKAPKIVVAEGAKFRGSVDMGAPRPKEQSAGEQSKAK
ncbi:MAG TPA: polymer-forming cytoskeletal protein [Thermoanaerobaculia bacterium]|nr:polymer-forming cytoskeletal protein [Thermoanaerobaculia bacterium]